MDVLLRREAYPDCLAPVVLVLGPVAVRDAAGAEVGLGGMRPRRLLAGLAIHAGDPVPADRLADIVWGERPPRSARANLHTYLWSLRRCLADAGGPAVIDASPAGYVLRTDPGVLDWHLFRDLAAAAAGIAGSDPAAAGHLLRQGLGLWRGPAAADLDGGPPAVAARIAAMDEARLAALEQRIEADLAAGHHRDLAPELAELTAAHPLREQFRAAQMTALYRSGRQADALTAFHQLRHHLTAELGIDPSPPLRALHQAILRNDPLLWPATPADGAAPNRPDAERLTVQSASDRAPGPVPARPDQLADQVDMHGDLISPQQGAVIPGRAGPAGGAAKDVPSGVTLGQRVAAEEARLFQGRRAELARMLSLLATPALLPRVVQVHGPAGIGKTAFAHALARECNARGWPAVILDSRDFRHDVAGLTEALAARCGRGWPPICDLPLLLVLDTVEEMRDMEHQLWEAVLPRITGPVLVVLSGRRPTPVFARPTQWHDLVDELELRGLPEAESRRLVQMLGVRADGLIGEILAFGRGNPLFLSVAAQHARSTRTGSLESYGPMTHTLIGRMTREIADPDVRKLLDAASLVRTFNQELLAAMLDRDVSGSFEALRELSVVRPVPAGLRLHDLVRYSAAADFHWRAPQACQEMRQRAYKYLAQRAQSGTDAGPDIQELLHLAVCSAALARFYAQADHPDVHVRPVSPEDLSRLTELCHTGITRFGLPPGERIRQMRTDLPVAWRSFAVALNDAGAITGFAYSVRLNRDTWRIAAETREAFFATLPEPERAAIMMAPPTALRATMVTGATHLPGYDHVSAALRRALFLRDRRTLSAGFVAYHLMTPESLEESEVSAAGLSRRARNIDLGGCLVDEWLLSFGDGGLLGWIGEVVGASTASTSTRRPEALP